LKKEAVKKRGESEVWLDKCNKISPITFDSKTDIKTKLMK
jgi:hypothetical protein